MPGERSAQFQCVGAAPLRTLQRRQERGGFGRLRSGGENRLLVGLHHGQPVFEILRVIGAGFIADAEIGTQECGSEFGDKFFHRIGVIAEALAELAIAAVLAARPVGQLMQQRGIVGLGGRARR
jgi:hypothetical protein